MKFSDLLWMVFITLILMITENKIETNGMLEGIAKSNFLQYYHGLDVAPDEARYLNVVITTYDVTVENLDIFTK